MSHSVVSIPVHFVFSTRNREPVIGPEWAAGLYAVCGAAAAGKGARLLAAGGVADHVHLLVALGRESGPAALMAAVKANASRHAAAHSPGFAWQRGYAAFGVGWDGLSRVRTYIAGQEKHHARKSFQDELRRMFRVHEVEYDERDVWG